MRRHGRRSIVSNMVRKQKHRCYLCGASMTLRQGHWNTATIDHVVPRSRLKRMAHQKLKANHKAACYKCNQAKGSMTAQEYLVTLESVEH